MFGVKNHYMKSTILKVFMCIAMLATAFSTLHAQEIITVSGKILNLFWMKRIRIVSWFLFLVEVIVLDKSFCSVSVHEAVVFFRDIP